MSSKEVLVSAISIAGMAMNSVAANFGDDLDFLNRHTKPVVLSDKTGRSQVIVVPAWQGRVMTSTADGVAGASYGWVNRELIAEGKLQKHINVFGGEDRFWMGPEGGQFSIFFEQGSTFDLDHWFTPSCVDTESFEVLKQAKDRIICRKKAEFFNYSRTQFQVEITREVRIAAPLTSLRRLGVNKIPDSIKSVAFESINTLKNVGTVNWSREKGLLSIWILGMMNASPETTVIIPYATGSETVNASIVKDDYFGKVPPERLIVRDGVIFFKADSLYRSKIGVSPASAKNILGSYDSRSSTLTVVEFSLPKGQIDYVNSAWELQKEPFRGDVVNSYNDGPPKPGAKQMGKFYELESSSPALALKSGASATHRHKTIHLQGSPTDLEPIARVIFGVGIAQVKSIFDPQ